MSGKRRGWNANIPTRWLTDPTIRDLSGDALAAYFMGLMYGVEHENDGAMPMGSLRWLLPPDADADVVTRELEAAGLWEATDTGFQIVDWSSTQTTRAEQERTRKQNRDRQSEYQKRQKALDDSRVNNALVTQPPDIRPDQTISDKQESAVNSETGEVADGTAARIGDSSSYAASATVVFMMTSNSTGVKRPRAACLRRRW